MRNLIFISLLFVSALSFSQGLVPGIVASSGGEAVVYTDEYQAVLDAMTTDPTGDTLTWQNDLTYSIDTAGLWDRMDILHVFSQVNEQGALLNWINPDSSAIPENAPDHSLAGYTGDNFTTYITTENPTNGSNYAQNSASVGVYIQDNIAENKYAFGASDGVVDVMMAPRYSNDNAYMRINETTTIIEEASTNSSGLWMTVRNGSTDEELWRNGSSFATASNASSAVPDTAFVILTRGVTGHGYGTNTISVFFSMDGLSDSEVVIMNTIIETYMDKIGKGVQ